ncbi:MAG TPA: helix-turn-helix transcriptional regulator [Rhodothermales bacterium]|nr:helix-turn-helix transcriptional regulator [Rhodothermales bacterium]
MDRFGEKLRALRNRGGLTLADLASRLGYHTHSYLSEVESGKKAPTTELVVKVAREFGVTTDELLKDELDVNHQGDDHGA